MTYFCVAIVSAAAMISTCMAATPTPLALLTYENLCRASRVHNQPASLNIHSALPFFLILPHIHATTVHKIPNRNLLLPLPSLKTSGSMPRSYVWRLSKSLVYHVLDWTSSQTSCCILSPKSQRKPESHQLNSSCWLLCPPTSHSIRTQSTRTHWGMR